MQLSMRSFIPCFIVAFAVTATPAFAQSGGTIEPHDLVKQANAKPALTLTEQQKTEIQDAMVTVHNAQKLPKGFTPQVGAKLPTALKTTAIPSPLNLKQPALKQYDYVKLPDQLLIVDPMKVTIVAMIPLKFPAATTGQATNPDAAPSGETHDPASKGHQAETGKKEP
jgi:hypothetical protein